jgi:hypothetical protein
MAADGEPDQAVELSQSEEEELRAGTERALHQHRFGSAWSRYFDVKADLEARRAARLSAKLVAARARREAEAAKQPAQLQDRRLQAQVLDYERQLQREARPPEPVIDEPAIDGRLERWRIPLLSFWWILEQRVKRGELAEVKSLSEHTRRSSRLEFVGRTRVGNLVGWIDGHPDEARCALKLDKIPAAFRANERGVLVPKLRKIA